MNHLKPFDAMIFNSPIGNLTGKATAAGICSLEFQDSKQSMTGSSEISFNKLQNPHLLKLKNQLAEYFSGYRTAFNLSLIPEGTSFQQKVWAELQKIQFGKTRTYKEQSLSVGDVKSIRAVATANGANPIAIVVPCHRIIGTDGSLTGYAGGLWRKKWLLDFEAAQSGSNRQLNLLNEFNATPLN